MVRHRRMLAPINSIKHYVQMSNIAIASGAVLNTIMVDAVVAPATAATSNVIQGAVIKAIYVEMWIVGDGASGTSSQFVLIVHKIRNAEPQPSNSNLINLQAWVNKKNILYTTQGVVPPFLDGGMSVPVVRMWILIPKGKQRFGLDDQFMVSVAGVGKLRVCGFTTYKEYR